MRYIFTQIFKEMSNLNIRPGSAAAKAFAAKRVLTMKKTNPDKLIKRMVKKGAERGGNQGGIGDMFLFQYDPKYKNNEKILPYYDRFPLIIMFDHGSKYTLGINFHYLPYSDRVIFLEALRLLGPDKSLVNDDYALDNITYKNIKQVTSDVEYWKPSIKRYLNKHISGRLIKVHPEEWDLILLLPIERFVRARRARVFTESRAKY